MAARSPERASRIKGRSTPLGSTHTPVGKSEIVPVPPLSSHDFCETVLVIRSLSGWKSAAFPALAPAPAPAAPPPRPTPAMIWARRRSSPTWATVFTAATGAPAAAWAPATWASAASRCGALGAFCAAARAGANSPAANWACKAASGWSALEMAAEPRYPAAANAINARHRARFFVPFRTIDLAP